MKLIPIILLLFLLVACAEEFPPNPPAPGETQLAGKAIGGIPIAPGSLPKWAAEIKYTDIDPTQVKNGDTVKVTVTKPTSVKTKFYTYAIAYAYNKKFKFWEKVFADTSKSGKILKTWAEDTATFLVPISSDRFLPGPNYVVIYWCIDTEKRDSKGFKIWDCQGSKWQLGAFEMLGGTYPDILIERDIENNRYKSSVKADLPAGTAYTANYETLTSVKTDVTVLQAKNVDDFKKELAKSVAELEPKWTKRGNVCGFLSAAAGQVTFGWLSGANWLTVTTYASTVDDAKIGVYGIKYPSDCDLMNTLRNIVPSSLCGNNKVDAAESCDGTDDSACPGACRPDCSCMATGDANFGFCGDNIIEKPNKDGVTEDCEPPGARDPVTGQLVSSACFLRNTLGQITGTGACDDKCKCIAAQFTKSACGDGKADPGEQCGDPGTPGCGAGNMCVNCKCWAVPLTCGNGVKDAGEQCDPGKPGAACPAGQTCSGNCLCVKKSKCGNGKVEPGEQCEKAADCPNGLPGTFKVCLACGCAYFGWPIGGCGDGNVDKAAGEECEADKDCANPPGGIVSPTCNKTTCKCNKVCGDGKISSPNDEVPAKNEECDPPGRIGPCPPIILPGGGCAIPLCKNDCTCPSGDPCQAPVGCGDGSIDRAAGEECEKPGDWCGCAIGADGAISCLLCSSTCKCGPSKAGSSCPGQDCGPVNGITMGANTGYTGSGTFYTLGTKYPTFDNPNAVAADSSFKGTQCGQVCVSSVVNLGVVDTDGSDVTQDGACYYVSASLAMSSIGPITASSNIIAVSATPTPAPTPHVSRSYTITGMKSSCISSSQISEPVAENGKCVAKQLSCPINTQCQTTSSGAACVPVALGTPPTVPTQTPQQTQIPTSTPSSSYTAVPNTNGCTADTPAGCYKYYTGANQAKVCSGTYNGCYVSYTCSSSGQLMEYHNPPGCTGSYTGAATTGQAIFAGEISDVAQSKGIQIALFLVAAMGILVITLLNFVHKE